jgi:hypothetical protein
MNLLDLLHRHLISSSWLLLYSSNWLNSSSFIWVNNWFGFCCIVITSAFLGFFLNFKDKCFLSLKSTYLNTSFYSWSVPASFIHFLHQFSTFLLISLHLKVWFLVLFCYPNIILLCSGSVLGNFSSLLSFICFLADTCLLV